MFVNNGFNYLVWYIMIKAHFFIIYFVLSSIIVLSCAHANADEPDVPDVAREILMRTGDVLNQDSGLMVEAEETARVMRNDRVLPTSKRTLLRLRIAASDRGRLDIVSGGMDGDPLAGALVLQGNSLAALDPGRGRSFEGHMAEDRLRNFLEVLVRRHATARDARTLGVALYGLSHAMDASVVTDVTYVGFEVNGNGAVHRIVFRVPELDARTYIVQIEADAPHRLRHIRSVDVPRETQFDDRPRSRGARQWSIQITEWETDSRFDESVFTLDLDDTVRVDRLSQVFSRGRLSSRPEHEPHDLMGEPAPEFRLSRLDGKEIGLSNDLGGKVVVLDFWATWCAPCIRAMPKLVAITDTYADEDFALLAINVGEDEDTIRTFLERHEFKLDVPMDLDSEVANAYGAAALPTTFVIDREGVVRAVQVGYQEDLEELLRETIDWLLR